MGEGRIGPRALASAMIMISRLLRPQANSPLKKHYSRTVSFLETEFVYIYNEQSKACLALPDTNSELSERNKFGSGAARQSMAFET